ncbi:MAG TPA: GIY-YIG nuclease family protein [Methylomirabilota bacterium]|nr:GIY-YIG nuclease family protein [Methylomirabilota bacterium]
MPNFPAVVYHAYMMASTSGVLYIGGTNHLERRVVEHQSKRAQGFSGADNTTKLVYFEPFNDIRNAIARGKQWKTWRREQKDRFDRTPQSTMARPK